MSKIALLLISALFLAAIVSPGQRRPGTGEAGTGEARPRSALLHTILIARLGKLIDAICAKFPAIDFRSLALI